MNPQEFIDQVNWPARMILPYARMVKSGRYTWPEAIDRWFDRHRRLGRPTPEIVAAIEAEIHRLLAMQPGPDPVGSKRRVIRKGEFPGQHT